MSGAVLFPTDVRWRSADPRTFSGPWHPAEERVVASAVEKRRREFGCGRHLARQLLEELGRETGPLLPRSDRRLPWPLEVAGSVSHCADLCVVAVAFRSHWTTLGVDVEPDTPLQEDTLPIVATEAEQLRFSGELAASAWGKSTFVAKEAYYKAQYELTRRFLEFTDVEVTFEAPPVEGRLVRYTCRSARAPTLEGTLRRSAGHVWAFSGLLHG